jgi:hypothetical protein
MDDILHDYGIRLALHHSQIYHFYYNDAFPVEGDKALVADHDQEGDNHGREEEVEVEEEEVG